MQHGIESTIMSGSPKKCLAKPNATGKTAVPPALTVSVHPAIGSS